MAGGLHPAQAIQQDEVHDAGVDGEIVGLQPGHHTVAETLERERKHQNPVFSRPEGGRQPNERQGQRRKDEEEPLVNGFCH
jgi:hypothetical protein